MANVGRRRVPARGHIRGVLFNVGALESMASPPFSLFLIEILLPRSTKLSYLYYPWGCIIKQNKTKQTITITRTHPSLNKNKQVGD